MTILVALSHVALEVGSRFRCRGKDHVTRGITEEKVQSPFLFRFNLSTGKLLQLSAAMGYFASPSKGVQQLNEKAKGLFVHASTACRFLENQRDYDRRLQLFAFGRP
jgi:hypothetical protein